MSSARPAAVVLEMDVHGLAIARSLGRRGIQVWGVDKRAGRWSLHSRYCHGVVAPDLNRGDGPLLEALIELGRRSRGAVLYALHDGYLTFVARNRPALEHCYRIAQPDNTTIETLVDKRLLVKACRRAGIPVPDTWMPCSEDEVRAISREVPFPCLLKPAFSRAWRTARAERVLKDAKVLRVASAGELLDAYRCLTQIGGPLLVQEEIPGPDRNLHYYSGYHGQGGVGLAEFAFRKLRTLPVHAGPGTLVESMSDPSLRASSLRFAQSLSYRGNLGLEFKLDPRDGVRKLLDANARFGFWDGFAAELGVDLAYCSYRDTVGRPVSFSGTYRTGICSIDLRRDLEAVVQLCRRRELGAVRWLSSLSRVRSEVSFARDDPAPFVHVCWLIARRVARGAARKAAALSSRACGIRAPERRHDG